MHAQTMPFLINNRDINSRDIIDDCAIRVAYSYSFPLDTLSGNRYSDVMRLDIGRKCTHYYSWLAEMSDSIMYRARLENRSGGVSTIGFLKDGERPQHEDIYFNYPKDKHLFTWTRISHIEYIYEETIPVLKWEILPDTDSVLGYGCIKASTEFRGRKFIAWFTPEIPIRSGPWKFSGLPGLILRVTDSENKFNWIAIGLEQPVNEFIYTYNTTGKKNMPHVPRIDPVHTTRQNVEKLKRQIWEDPVGLRVGHGGTVSTFDKSTGKYRTLSPGEIKYDYIPPLELE